MPVESWDTDNAATAFSIAVRFWTCTVPVGGGDSACGHIGWRWDARTRTKAMPVEGWDNDNAAIPNIGAANVWTLPNALDGGDSVCAVTGCRGVDRTLTWADASRMVGIRPTATIHGVLSV